MATVTDRKPIQGNSNDPGAVFNEADSLLERAGADGLGALCRRNCCVQGLLKGSNAAICAMARQGGWLRTGLTGRVVQSCNKANANAFAIGTLLRLIDPCDKVAPLVPRGII